MTEWNSEAARASRENAAARMTWPHRQCTSEKSQKARAWDWGPGSLDGEKQTQSLFTVQTIFCIYSGQGLLRQWDKWVRPQWPVAPMHVLAYTQAQGSLVSSSYLAMVNQAQLSDPLLRIQIFSSDSYVVKEGAAISITSLGHALSSSTTLGAQLPWFWLLHLSSMTFLLLPFLFIYL